MATRAVRGHATTTRGDTRTTRRCGLGRRGGDQAYAMGVGALHACTWARGARAGRRRCNSWHRAWVTALRTLIYRGRCVCASLAVIEYG